MHCRGCVWLVKNGCIVFIDPNVGFSLADYGSRIELKSLQIIWNNDGPLEVLTCLGTIGFGACVKVCVLGMIEHQVLHAEFLSKHSGIERRAVVFLIGIENEAVFI